MCISYCSGVRCLCASCVNEVNNLRVDIGELREPCFHCEDNCYVYDHNELKKVRNINDCPNYAITKYHANKQRKAITIINGGSR